jgi:hypothetical protein
MPISLQDLYANPKFIEKVEKPIKAEIMSWTFETENPNAINSSEVPPIAITLGPVKFSDEEEERIQGEVVVCARIAVTGEITIKVRTGEGEMTENITRNFQGFMNFSLPWSWQARSVDFVVESADVALNDLALLS